MKRIPPRVKAANKINWTFYPSTGANAMKQFYYSTGELVMKGDIIMEGNSKGVVIAVLQPNTEEAESFCCKDTGGLLLDTEKWGFETSPWPDEDEDLVFVKRADGAAPS